MRSWVISRRKSQPFEVFSICWCVIRLKTTDALRVERVPPIIMERARSAWQSWKPHAESYQLWRTAPPPWTIAGGLGRDRGGTEDSTSSGEGIMHQDPNTKERRFQVEQKKKRDNGGTDDRTSSGSGRGVGEA